MAKRGASNPRGNALVARSRRPTFILFSIPGLFLYSFFFIYPVLLGIYYSLTDWDGLALKKNFIGLKNYFDLFKYNRFLNAMSFTLKYAAILLVCIVVLSTLLALFLNRSIKGMTFYRGMFFMPAVLCGITISLVFSQIFMRAIPSIGQAIGSEFWSKNILDRRETAMYGILFVNIWQGVAMPTVLMLAGLQTVPTELYESAMLDGANAWHTFWKITFPFLLPLYITIVTAMKPAGESIRNFFTLPSSLYLENFKKVLGTNGYWRAFGNTVLIAVVVLVGNVVILPPLSYAITRSMGTSKIASALYIYLLIGIFIPFQVKMIPLVKMMTSFGLATPLGLAVLCIGSNTCESTFLYVGYMQSLPAELEEAAYIDGATAARTFYSVMMPLLTPILAAALIKEALWLWNDYMLPMMILKKSEHFTLTLFAYNFKSTDTTDYGILFACYLLQMALMLIFYLFAQKHIIGGLTSGAVKG